MRAMAIVGFGKSGKTTLVSALADSLEARGLRVAVAKSAGHALDKADTDTAKCMKPGRTVLAVGRGGAGESMIHWGELKHLADLVPLVEADILLVEGGKSLGWLPRVLCLKDASEREALDCGLAVASWGNVSASGLPALGTDGALAELAALTDLVLERAFLLPGLDCGACGEAGCAGLAQKIVGGGRRPDDCAALSGSLAVSVNGHPVGLNPFTARMLAGGIKGMLSALKGYAPGGTVHIELKS